MKVQRQIKNIQSLVLLSLLMLGHLTTYGTSRKLTVKLRGVYDSKITLTPFNGVSFALPLEVVPGVKNGGEVQFAIPDSLLPGEFLIRFNYRVKETDWPYPGDLQLYINREAIRVEANPLYLHGDSLILVGDRENGASFAFSDKSALQRQQITLLRQLLDGYDSPSSPEWAEVLKAYEKRRLNYNGWIDSTARAQQNLYVSHLFGFQKIKAENWKVKPAARLDALAHEWFRGFNFNDTLLLRSRQMNELMDGFVNLYGTRATTEALRDSLFTEAGKLAIGLASAGDSRVYGWMVDYFYKGYEAYNIRPGMVMLEEHLNNPRCLTSKRLAIAKRLEGIKKIVPGVPVRNLLVHNVEDVEEIIDVTTCKKDYRLLLFYDSECDHCQQLLEALRNWYIFPTNSARLEVVSVSLDRTREVWETAFKANAFSWTDRYAPGGINSQAASDYYVLSAPYMYLVDKNGVLASIPNTVEEMEAAMKKRDINESVHLTSK